MNSSTSRIELNQNGIYLLGQSTIDDLGNEDTLLRNVTKLNQRMASSKAMTESFNFGNGFNVSTQQMVDQTIGGIFSPSILSRYGFDTGEAPGINYTVQDKLDKSKLRGLLAEEGINISDTKLGMTTNFIALDPKLYSDPAGLGARAHVIPFHELGHTGSEISGMGSLGEKYATKFAEDAFASVDDISNLPLNERIKSFFTLMAFHGKEEARAESFGIYSAAYMKSLGEASDTMVADQVLKSVRQGNIAYTGSMDFHETYGSNIMEHLFPGESTAGTNIIGQFGDAVAKRAFVEDMIGPNSPLQKNSILSSTIKAGLDVNAELAGEISITNISDEVMKSAKALASEGKTPLSKLFTRPKIAGGMSGSTLQNIIDSSLQAARVMR